MTRPCGVLTGTSRWWLHVLPLLVACQFAVVLHVHPLFVACQFAVELRPVRTNLGRQNPNEAKVIAQFDLEEQCRILRQKDPG